MLVVAQIGAVAVEVVKTWWVLLFCKGNRVREGQKCAFQHSKMSTSHPSGDVNPWFCKSKNFRNRRDFREYTQQVMMWRWTMKPHLVALPAGYAAMRVLLLYSRSMSSPPTPLPGLVWEAWSTCPSHSMYNILWGQEKPSDLPNATCTHQQSWAHWFLYASQVHKLDFVFRMERPLLLGVFFP